MLGLPTLLPAGDAPAPRHVSRTLGRRALVALGLTASLLLPGLGAPSSAAAQQPPAPPANPTAPPANADIAFTAQVQAAELHWDTYSTLTVHFTVEPATTTTWAVTQTNLPEQPRTGTTYRDVTLQVAAGTAFASDAPPSAPAPADGAGAAPAPAAP